MIGRASTNRPTVQGAAIRLIRRREESCTVRTPRISRFVRCAVMAGMIAAVMFGIKASGRLKMDWPKLYTPLAVSAAYCAMSSGCFSAASASRRAMMLSVPAVTSVAELSMRDITVEESIRLMICRPAEPMVMGTAMASSAFIVSEVEVTLPPPFPSAAAARLRVKTR